MTRTNKTGRSLVSRKLVGTIFAVFALFVQPLVALDVPSAFAATADITQLKFTTGTQTIVQGDTSAVITVQTQNTSDASESLDTSGTKLNVVSSSPTGEFSENGSTGWTSTPSFTMSSGTANKNFRYRDSSTGTFTLTATAVDASNVLYEWAAATQQITVNAVPAPSATLASGLGSSAVVNDPVDFEASIEDVANATGANVRVKTTFTTGNPSDVVFEYQEIHGGDAGTYQPMEYTGGVYYFGSDIGFPLQNATSQLRMTFKEAGTYTVVSQIIDVATGDPIGAPVTRVVAVSAPATPSGTRYVSTTGSDTDNDCLTKTAPCETIQRAIDQANDGEAVRVARGTYNEAVNVNKPVKLLGAQANTDPRPSTGTTRTIGSSSETVVKAQKGQQVFTIAANDVTINGFEMRQEGGAGAADAVKASNSQTNITIKNNMVANATDEAIQLEAGTAYTVAQNYIVNPIGDGITLSTYDPLKGDDMRILNNDISGSQSAYGSI